MHSAGHCIEGDSPSLSPWPVLSKEPVPFHSSTPVTGAIPPHLWEPNKIVAPQNCAPHTAALVYRHFREVPQHIELLGSLGDFSIMAPCRLFLGYILKVIPLQPHFVDFVMPSITPPHAFCSVILYVMPLQDCWLLSPSPIFPSLKPSL